MINKLESIKKFKDLVKSYNKHKFRLTDSNKKTVAIYDDSYCFKLICNYIDLLDKPLTLDMFVPCVDGVPLKKPKEYNVILGNSRRNTMYEKQLNKYQEAEKNVLFKGFENCKIHKNEFNTQMTMGVKQFILEDNKIIDLLTIFKSSIELTEACKQLIKK